jgi:hypothetical protein
MKIKVLLFFQSFFLVLSLNSYAQLTPAPSSSQTLIQGFGLGKITVNYSRPNVKGRKIFGFTEPFDSVWRTGANWATTLNFTDDITMEGNKVPAGEYSLFTIPGKDQWTIILNKTVKQWGAYSYKKSNDFLRFTLKPKTIKENVETFTLEFADVYPTHGELNLFWEHTQISILLAVDIDAKVMARIDSAMQSPKKPYYDAVIYYWNNNKDMNKALSWANELEKVPGMPPMVAKLWKSRVLLKLGNKSEALTVAKEGEKAALTAKSDEYQRLNSEIIKEASQ